MSKYVIVPKMEYISEAVEASSTEDALVAFATSMDTDMNLYFQAIEAEKYDEYMANIRRQIQDEHVISFMQNELMENFGIKDEEKARDLAEDAYEKYCEGNGETQYECIEWVADKEQKRASAIEDYIMAFQDLCEWDDQDDFEDERLRDKIYDAVTDAEFNNEEPTREEMAEVVKDVLYKIQYGDTSDADDLARINEDYHERFPNGR